ncbi:solute carrier organic anion transporter family member 4A1-like [Acanthaster planci]|uniref:Solute carrier organic anion transporter family member n=1 Tax=Acanthaster planci TaxID=133434 RepID=A0A8B7ZG13_ACAPL|nr:solute carrier organic anion transporter family member 4A1-like [Acanthaster planci]
MTPDDDGLVTDSDGGHIENGNGNIQTEQNANRKGCDITATSDLNKDVEDPAKSPFRYGCFGWTPRWMQRFNRAPWLLIVLSAFCTAQGLVINGYINTGIGTIERRFELSSRASGLIVSMYDITCAILVLFVTYVGGRGHKPKWLTWGLIFMGTGSAIFALPHFTTGLYQPVVGADSILCTNDTSGEPQCQDGTGGDSSLSNYFYLFLVAQVFHGIGALPLYTLGVTLLDESVTTKQTGLYLAWFYGFSALGPALGLVSGGVFLGIYTDLRADSVNVTSSDPAWVGAWWIGFVIGAILSYIVAIPMSGFPTELPTTAKIRAEKESQAHIAGHEEEVTRPNFGTKLSDIPKAVKYLFINPTFVCVSLAASAESLVISGFATFSPKILGIQYGLSPGVSSAIVGIFAVPAAVGSTFLGGWLIKRFDLKVRGMLRLSIVCVIIVIVFSFCLLLICPQEIVAGINSNYYANETGIQDTLKDPCNADCGCDNSADYSPVCGDNNLQYFDPCHAGCKSNSEDGVFSDCSCLDIGNWTDSSLKVSQGQCPVDCGIVLPLFLIGYFISMFFNFMPGIPATNTCLRCVPDTQRSFALGVQWLFARLLGSVPGPILFGNVLDTSCLLWQDDCGSRGACWLYDRQMLAWKLLLIGAGFKGVSFLFFALSLIFYRSAHDNDGDEKKATDPGEVEVDMEGKRESYKRMESSSSTAEIVANAVYGETAEEGEVE